MAWAGFIAALAEDEYGVARVLSTRIKTTPQRSAQLPDIHTELAWCIEIESRWRTDIQNPDTKATGLIQFMPETAKKLGTTVEALRIMSLAEQSVYVQKYFDMVNMTCSRIGDIYLQMFNPIGMGKPDGFILYAPGSKGWLQNPGLRESKDGPITVASVRKAGTPPTEALPGAAKSSKQPPKNQPPRLRSPMGGAGLLLLGALIYLGRKRKRR